MYALGSKTGATTGAVSIHFQPPTSDGGSAITHYSYSLDNGTTWTQVAAGSIPIVSGGHPVGSYFRVKLKARNATGYGEVTPECAVRVPEVEPPSFLDASDDYRRTIRSSHKIAHSVDLWSWKSKAWESWDLTSAQVQSDWYSQVMRKMSGEVNPRPTGYNYEYETCPCREFGVYGSLVIPRRGVTYPNGVTEQFPLGVFSIDSMSHKIPGGTIGVAGTDLFSYVVRNRVWFPITVSGSRIGLVKWAITTSMAGILPWQVEFAIDPGIEDDTLPPVLLERELGEFVNNLLTAIGCIGFFDSVGVYTVQKVPTVESPPTHVLDTGDSGILLEVGHSLSRDNVYNAVVVKGEPTDQSLPIILAAAYDGDPESDTYLFGHFGRVPYYVTSQYIYTQEQANDTAIRQLNKVMSAQEQMSSVVIPDATIVPGSVVNVRVSSKSEFHYSGNDRYLVTGSSLTLAASDSMAVSLQFLGRPELFDPTAFSEDFQ